MAVSGFGPLITPADLAAILTEPDAVVFDSSYVLPNVRRDMKGEYLAERIPGAGFFDIDAIKEPASILPHMLPDPARFQDAVRQLGVGEDSRVVVYDRFNIAMAAARVWWTFRVFGHSRVAVLDGGLPAWIKAGQPTEAGPPTPRAAGDFVAAFRPHLVRSEADVKEAVDSGETQIVDARDAARFAGEAPELRSGIRSGHMPGARNLPFPELIDPDSGQLRDPAALKSAIEKAGIDLDQPIISSCGSGVTACVLALAAARIGAPAVAVYDGSWTEWGREGGPPIATGPAG